MSGLADTGATPVIPAYQFLGVQATAKATCRMSKALGIDIYPLLMSGPFITETEYDMLIKFLKMKHPTFVGCKTEDTFKFIV